METISVAIYGYGNVGKGVEASILQNKDCKLFGIFTRRNPEEIKSEINSPIYSVKDIIKYKDKIDVVIICGGSATELPEMTPELARNFNVVDSFDTHARIPEHYNKVNKESIENKHISLISCGWDPGMFSLNRLYSNVILPNGKDYTFWGKGVSQGHSDAIRHIKGVIDARQYTIPIKEALEKVRSGKEPELTIRQKHKRECYVVIEEKADKKKIEEEIKNMPNYFNEYDTIVNFISLDELKKYHSNLPHGGFVIRTGKTGFNNEHNHTIEYNLKLDSNPEFTANCLIAYARAIVRMFKRGIYGCKTVFDIAPVDLSILSPDELRKNML